MTTSVTFFSPPPSGRNGLPYRDLKQIFKKFLEKLSPSIFMIQLTTREIMYIYGIIEVQGVISYCCFECCCGGFFFLLLLSFFKFAPLYHIPQLIRESFISRCVTFCCAFYSSYYFRAHKCMFLACSAA